MTTAYEYTGDETVGIKVLAPTPTVKPQAGKPQIVIESFTAEPQPVPGGTFTLTLTLHNSGTGAARNVSLTHGAPSNFAVLGTGNVTSVGNIGWQQTVAVAIPLTVDPCRQGRRQPASHHPGLRQRRGRACASAQNIAIQVGQGEAAPVTPEPLVVIESYATEPEPLTPGQPFTLTLRVLNVGTARRPACDVDLGQTERRQRERAHRTARHRQRALSAGAQGRRTGRGGQSIHRQMGPQTPACM